MKNCTGPLLFQYSASTGPVQHAGIGWVSTGTVVAQYSMPVLAQLTASVQNCTGPVMFNSVRPVLR